MGVLEACLLGNIGILLKDLAGRVQFQISGAGTEALARTILSDEVIA